MRTLDRNKSTFWVVSPTGKVDVVNDKGQYTGEVQRTFSTPTKIKLSVYPYDGNIMYTVKGQVGEFDYIGVSESYTLNKDDLLFKVEPTGDYDSKYDYKVGRLLDSLNNSRFLLKARV